MNIGTKIRTILVIATCLNTALMATDIAQFGNATLDMVYKIASVVLNFIIVACATYYNNDYTEEACLGTGHTRYLKSVKNEAHGGEVFEDELSEELDDEQ